MIYSVNHRIRSLVAVLVAALAASLAPPARAQQDGWFEPGRQPAPPASGAQAQPPAQPAPLAPSPLIEDGPVPSEVNDQAPEALTKFRPYLDPYGTWVDDPSYGRVWVPSPGVVGPNFQPYVSNGRWALDETNEWVWVSDYSFGWVVFHYGRWVWIGGQGWAWIPGNQYAPAWVVWRVPSSDTYAYVGWAPAPPTFVWFGGFSVWWGYSPYYAWAFCPSPYLFHHHVGHYVVTDPYWQGYAARHTRPYSPASARPRTSAPPAYPTAHPTRSPSLAAARVPDHAVPRDRAKSYSPDARSLSSTRYDGPRQSLRSVAPAPRLDRSVRSTPGRFRATRPPAASAPRFSPSRPAGVRPGGARFSPGVRRGR